MSIPLPRRDVLKLLGAGAVATACGSGSLLAQTAEAQVAGRAVRIAESHLSPHTVRIIVAEHAATPAAVPQDGAVAATSAPPNHSAALLRVSVSHDPLVIAVSDSAGRAVQQLRIDAETGAVSFDVGDAPLFGLGEGGPQFDRRGQVYPNRSGQGGYHLRTHGGRVPIQWLISAAGWALFLHAPLGEFDLTGAQGVFRPPADSALPLDIFIVHAPEPMTAMEEYARITGYPEMPPLWALGYQQSHRTLANRQEILDEARTFREKKLPCDAMIYLGTGFCPNGWNTENGSFQFNSRVFDDPKAILDEFHALHFKVVLHAVILTRTLGGTVHDACALPRFDETEASCYWDAHRADFALGVDGWWPDEGDPLDAASRLTRNRMYYEGPQIDRPNQRPYALHRNGYAGMQRYAPFLWSGDVYSTWETLRTHVAVALNTAMSGIPLWGTDTGGFVPTKDLTGELYVRWFQFSSFCPLFRSHGRDWKLRLPWGWNTGELGPNELSNYGGGAANPDPSEFHNAEVEPICRKYLELRYRLLPYLYTLVREGHDTGRPILRALWLHYADDPAAIARDDEYLWGRDLLVAPVVEKAASERKLYLPRGDWFDFWSEERVAGGREVTRPVDLATMPLYARAGTILPLGPVKQYTAEKVDAPVTLVVYPGSDGVFTLYEDDGASFDYRRGEFHRTEMHWNDTQRRLTLRTAAGSRPPAAPRVFEVRLAGEKTTHTLRFSGATATVSL